MISFNQVSKHYPGGCSALLDVNFHIEPAEMVFLTGHSGAGKSTILKVIAHIEKCTNGIVVVNGQNLNRLSRRKVAFHRRDIGLIFQNPRLLFNRTLFDNVSLPLVIAGVSSKDIERRVRAALDKVGLLKKEKCLPSILSGGEQQRVGIARAIVNKPKVLLADEPTGNLDPELSQEILKLFENFNQVGVTVLMATHDMALIEPLNNRRIHLNHGQIVTN